MALRRQSKFVLRFITVVSFACPMMIGLGVTGGYAKTTSFSIDTVTLATSINDNGVMAGLYYSGNEGGDFIRNIDGSIIKFSPNGSNPESEGNSFINNAGEVAGSYFDKQCCTNHGYFRNADGTIVSFDVKGAVQTLVTGINPGGDVVGNWNADGVGHGFLRNRKGKIVSFDFPDGDVVDTQAEGINNTGDITGDFYIDGQPTHAYLRTKGGAFTSFDAPDAVNGTLAVAVNDTGQIAGYYYDSNYIAHGFVRSKDETIIEFDPPDSLYTEVYGINADGVVIGIYKISEYTSRAFIRNLDGTFTVFGSDGNRHQTTATSINKSGAVAGWRSSGLRRNYRASGFLRTP